tara:strand:- start:1500 stop:2681 length:1182 start_codon:yes stop_codon:yes gene_type:complete
MKYINFIFQVHQPYRLKEFHFFEIGNHQSYFDEKKNKTILRQVAERSYLPTNKLLLQLIKTYGKSIKISFAISGTALDQMEQYAPEVLESFKQLAATGNVEFLGQTYGASLASLINKTVFYDEVSKHQIRIKSLFGKTPTVFFNTGLIYSDAIGEMISNMGFKATIIEGLPSVLKGKNAFSVYNSPLSPSLTLFLRNESLSDDIALRFSQKDWCEWPLTTEKYMNWVKGLKPSEKVINLVMDYTTFGEGHKKDTGIFDFFEHLLIYVANEKNMELSTLQELATSYKAHSKLKVNKPISWAGKEKNLFLWQGNQLQQEALETLYKLENKIKETKDKLLLRDWMYLQSADHFCYMNHANGFTYYFINPYRSTYEAFLDYMNVLADIALRIENKTL